MKNTVNMPYLNLITTALLTFFVITPCNGMDNQSLQKSDTRQKETETIEIKVKHEKTESHSSAISHDQKKSVEIKSTFETFDDWYDACKNIQSKYDSFGGYNYKNTPPSLQEFKKVLEEFLNLMAKDTHFVNKDSWVENKDTEKNVTALSKAQEPIMLPFVQKLKLPETAELAFLGDIHGDIDALLNYLKGLQKEGHMDKNNGFKIKNKNLHLIFLGDYTNHGRYGTEVLYTLMRLKIANPSQVLLLRGNHEDIEYNNTWGLVEQFQLKFTDSTNSNDAYKLMCHLYDFLPVALYVGTGTDYILCCHGAIELGFNPKALLQHKADKAFAWLESLETLSKNAETLRANLQGEEEYYSPVTWLESLNESNELKTNKEYFLPDEKNESYQYKRDTFKKFEDEIKKFYLALSSCTDGRQTNGFVLNHFHHNGNKYRIGLSDANDDSLTFDKCKRVLSLSRNVTKKILSYYSEENANIHGVFCAQESDFTSMKNDKKNVNKLWGSETGDNNDTLWPGIVCGFSTKHPLAILIFGKTFKDWKTNF